MRPGAAFGHDTDPVSRIGEIMGKLDEGGPFIATRNGVPVGELTPLRRHRFVVAETAVGLFRAAPAVDGRRFRSDLDQVASQTLHPLPEPGRPGAA